MNGSNQHTADQVIQASDLSVGYHGHLNVLSNLSYEWKGPGIHLIIGENGSGKSTLIRTLAGLQSPMAGLVKWNGEDVALISSPRRVSNMAFVQSIPPRQSELTVSEALALHEPNQNKVDDLLDAFNLGEMHMKSLCDLSDGLAQRVMLVRAILQDTPWILLDEPTAFFDVKSRQVMWSQLSALVAKGRHVMVSSHDYHLLEGNPDLMSVTTIGADGLEALDPAGSFESWNASI
ncbi:MAG: ATP-binding cassette domain-containing protein [Crocinitomicaceae bacterium]|nr:ATP-binding cassette domain-containing protein [Crocinitomicaceae bacterium]